MPKFLGRITFALFCSSLFFISLLSGVFLEYAWIPVLVVLVIGFLMLFRGDPITRARRAQRVGKVVGVVLSTNNRWWLTLGLLVVLSFGLAVMTPVGEPLIQSELRKSTTKDQYQIGDGAERMRNIFVHGKAQTNRELQPAVQYPSWTPFRVRWQIFLVLLVLWAVYTPIAFSDEVRAAFARTRDYFRNTTEGVAGPGLFQSLKQQIISSPATQVNQVQQPPVATASQSAPGAPNPPRSWWSVFLPSLVAEVIGEGGERIIARFFRR